MEITDHGFLELIFEDESSSAPDIGDLLSPLAVPVHTCECQVHRPDSLSSDVNSMRCHDIDVLFQRLLRIKLWDERSNKCKAKQIMNCIHGRWCVHGQNCRTATIEFSRWEFTVTVTVKLLNRTRSNSWSRSRLNYCSGHDRMNLVCWVILIYAAPAESIKLLYRSNDTIGLVL